MVFPCINVCQVPREMLKTEDVGRGFQHLPRDLVNVNVLEKMFDRCYCINSTIYLLKFGKLYGTIFCHRLAVSERVHIFKYPSSWSERIKRFKMAAIIRFDLDVSKMTYKVVAVQL